MVADFEWERATWHATMAPNVCGQKGETHDHSDEGVILAS